MDDDLKYLYDNTDDYYIDLAGGAMHSEMKLTFATADILRTVIENRDKHKATYEEAYSGWKDDLSVAAAELSATADSFVNSEVEYDEVAEAMARVQRITKPRHYLKDYDRAIAMFEATTQDQIELDMQDFARYMRDEWDWQGQFVASTTSYLNKRRV